MGKVALIAVNTFRESIRDKILYIIFVFAAVIMLASVALGWVSIGDQLQVTQHFSLAAISFFGALIAVFSGAGMIHKEIERRTIHTILSKPVERWQFVVGKFFGLYLTLLLALLGMIAVSVLFVLYTSIVTPGAGSEWAVKVHWGRYFLAAGMTCAEAMVVVALAILFGSVTSPVLSAVFTFIGYLVGQVTGTLTYIFTKFQPAEQSVASVTGEHLTDWVSSAYWLIKPFSVAIYYILPDLRHFQIRNQVVFGPEVSASQVYWALIYAVAYSAAALVVAVWFFNRRRF